MPKEHVLFFYPLKMQIKHAQVTAQLKILTTAVFSVLMLGRALGMEKVRINDERVESERKSETVE